MKIKHNIIRDWKTLRGRILDTIFEEGEKRGDGKIHYSKDKKFYICSFGTPELTTYGKKDVLYVFWVSKTSDNQEVSYTYETEEEAQRVLDYINEFTIKDQNKKEKFWYVFIPWEWQPTFKHKTISQAKHEAKRLAQKTGKETFILEAIKSYQVISLIENDYV